MFAIFNDKFIFTIYCSRDIYYWYLTRVIFIDGIKLSRSIPYFSIRDNLFPSLKITRSNKT